MALKVYGHAGAICTKRVLVTLKELSVPHELVSLDLLKGEHKAPEHVANHPFGKIPYIVDDGFVLYESRAICLYLARKFGKHLIPGEGDVEGWAKFDQAASVELNCYNPPSEQIGMESFKAPLQQRPVSQEVLDKESPALDAVLKIYDEVLGRQKYLAGNKFSLVDVFHMPTGDLCFKAGAGSVFEKHENVNRWWKDITSRPAAEVLAAAWP